MKNLIILKKTDKILLFTSIILFIIGLIMIFSASNVVSYMNGKKIYGFFIKQAFIVSASYIVALFLIKVPLSYYKSISWGAIIVSIVLLLYVSFFGEIINNARSWIYIWKFSLQPSELAKIATIMWIACNYKGFTVDNKAEKSKNYGIFILIMLIISFMIYNQPDLGTTIIFMSIVIIMYLKTPSDILYKKIVSITSGVFIIAVSLFLVFDGYKYIDNKKIRERTDYDNPCSSEKFYTYGGQLCNSFIAFNNGGLLGKGLGESTQKYLYLAEPYTDFIFAIVVEELGLIGGIGVLLLIFIVLWRIYIIGKKTKNDRGKLICIGVFYYILIHIFVNLGGITGLIPMTGVPLPFISYGGTFALSLIIALTMVQRVAIENN